MGIEGFWDRLKKHYPEVIERIPLSHWRGRRIAIDLSNWIYRNTYSAHKSASRGRDLLYEEADSQAVFRHLANLFIGFVTTILEAGATPVIVLDGQPPVAKTAKQAERKETKDADRDKHAALRQHLQQQTMPEDGLSEEALKQQEEDYAQLKRYDARLFTVSEHFEPLCDLAAQLGLPMEKATGEAEKMAAMLCIDGYVSAAFTRDADALILGCPVVIEGFEKPDHKLLTAEMKGDNTEEAKAGGKPKITSLAVVVRLARVLEVLELTFPQLVDVGILAGCDYNENIPGLGIAKAIAAIKAHGDLDSFLAAYPEQHAAAYDRRIRAAERKGKTVDEYEAPDLTILNVAVCRECFAYEPSETLFADVDPEDDRTIVERLTVVPRDQEIISECVELLVAHPARVHALLRALGGEAIREPLELTHTQPPG